MKKLLLNLIVATCAANSFADGFSNNVGGVPNLGILNGNSFSSLPSTSEIKKFALSTVGFTYTKPAQGDIPAEDSACTGVAIANNLLLTANHCTISNKGVKYFDAGSSLNMYVTGSADAGTLQKGNISKIFRGYVTAPHNASIGDDVAIIKFPNNTFKQFIPSNRILATSDLIPKDAVVDKLMANIYDSPKNLYFLGWGSNKKFQFAKVNVRSNTGSPQLTFEANTNSYGPTYNLKDENGNYGIYKPLAKTHERIGTKDLKLSSFTNIMTYQNIIFDDILQGGDSGGPNYICDQNGNACWLIAINTYVWGIGESGSTTLANPFFDLIYDAAKK